MQAVAQSAAAQVTAPAGGINASVLSGSTGANDSATNSRAAVAGMVDEDGEDDGEDDDEAEGEDLEEDDDGGDDGDDGVDDDDDDDDTNDDNNNTDETDNNEADEGDDDGDDDPGNLTCVLLLLNCPPQVLIATPSPPGTTPADASPPPAVKRCVRVCLPFGCSIPPSSHRSSLPSLWTALGVAVDRH